MNSFQVIEFISQSVCSGGSMATTAGGDMDKIIDVADNGTEETNGRVTGRKEFDAIRCFWSKLSQSLD